MPTEARPRRPLSLTLRITALVGGAMSVLLVVCAAFMERSLHAHFLEQDLGEMSAVAESLATALGPHPMSEPRQAVSERLSRAVAGHHDVYFGVHDAAGEVLFSTAPKGLFELASTAPAATALDIDALRDWEASGQVYRGALLRMQGVSLLVATSMAAHLRFLDALRRGLWASTLLACVLAVLGVWLTVRWGHAPLRRISATVSGITSERLYVRLAPAEVPAELVPLVVSFNGMLDQLEASFKRLTHFTADIAHELRTPVTSLSTQTQVALSRTREPQAYREVLYSSLEELERMGKMIGDMLYLAQADNPHAQPEMGTVDLAAEVRTLFDYFEALAEEQGVGLTLVGDAPQVPGNQLMLQRALSNLISNALRYTPQGQEVKVSLSARHAAVDIRVDNPGPEIAEEHLPRVFDRFYRADPARQRLSDGAGLGLSIVKAIAQAHGGSVSVTSGGGRTCFTLRLPAGAGAA